MNAEDIPFSVKQIRVEAPWWPYGVDGTYRLMRSGELRSIAIGKRRFLTLGLLRECLARHTWQAQPPPRSEGR